jgi:hypothetical protein
MSRADGALLRAIGNGFIALLWLGLFISHRHDWLSLISAIAFGALGVLSVWDRRRLLARERAADNPQTRRRQRSRWRP